jgi:hypothetical protein
MDTGGSITEGLKGRGVKLITYLHPMPRSIMVDSHLHSPIRFYGMLINYLSRETAAASFEMIVYDMMLKPVLSAYARVLDVNER